MFAYAFKNAAEAAKRESGLGKVFSLTIERVTGGRFSHVECWIDGPIDEAECFSSREPHGTSIQTIDLSDPALWTIVRMKTSAEQDALIRGFCMGSSGRPYDMVGIAGIGTGSGAHDPYARFCSEVAFEAGDVCLHLFPKGIERWMVAPDWPAAKPPRYGLFELASAA